MIDSILALASTMATSHAQNVEVGESLFRQCSPCHAVGALAENKVGPALNGLDGRRSGTVFGFAYSEPIKNANIVWSDVTFKEYIQNPQAKIPGTKMFVPGVVDEKKIADLWAYLKQFGADGEKK